MSRPHLSLSSSPFWALFSRLCLFVFAFTAGCSTADRVVAVVHDGGITPPTTWVPFGMAQPVVGLRTDRDEIQDPSLTADELEIFFTSGSGGVNSIWTSRRASVDGPWGLSQVVTELSNEGGNQDPSVSADGLTIHWSSTRGGLWMRIYVAQRPARDQPWQAPRSVGDLGSSRDDLSPTLTPTGTQMIFASLRGTATDAHLYASSRTSPTDPWTPPVPINAVNSDQQDRDPALYEGGRSLVFASRRSLEGRTSDLFRTRRTTADAAFVAAPERIEELSTNDKWEGDPWLSEDGRHIYFVSDRTGLSRIYEARR